MGRELRRKQAKKEGKSLKKEEIVEKSQISKLIKTVILLLVIIGAIYLISIIFITKEVDWFEKDEETQQETVTNSILASRIFEQSEETYYVYFYDFNDEDTNITSVITSNVSEELYRVDTNSALNAKYVSEESNKKAKKLDDLKVKAPTLIKISGDTITEYYEDSEILNELN